MKIAIDINGAFSQSGLSNYIKCLVKALAELDKENEYYLFASFWRDFSNKIKYFEKPDQRNVHVICARYPESLAKIIETEFGFRFYERLLESYQIDIFHGTGNILPRLKNIKSVLTLHHINDPMFNSSLWNKYYFNRLISKSALGADHIITESRYTKDDIIKTLGITGGKISVVYGGNPQCGQGISQQAASMVRVKYGLPEKFMLFMGPVNERKNLLRTIDALALLREKDIFEKIVVVGSIEENYFESVRRKCAELYLEKEVYFTGGVLAGEIGSFYAIADLLIYPSLVEGFGLPLLEAMSYSCPIIASNQSAIPEVVGNAGILIDPYNANEIAGAMQKLLSDRPLRSELVSKGFEQLKIFSWEKAAKETLEVYKKVYGQNI